MKASLTHSPAGEGSCLHLWLQVRLNITELLLKTTRGIFQKEGDHGNAPPPSNRTGDLRHQACDVQRAVGRIEDFPIPHFKHLGNISVYCSAISCCCCFLRGENWSIMVPPRQPRPQLEASPKARSGTKGTMTCTMFSPAFVLQLEFSSFSAAGV